MLKKQINPAFAILVVFMISVLTAYGLVAYAHHNSPMYETIEENENFDNMDQHEEAVTSIPDNSSMDTGATQGTVTDTANQSGSADGPDGSMNQGRSSMQ